MKYTPIRHKFNAQRVEKDGIKFPSKLEKQCYEILKKLMEDGIILFFLRQVPFDLPGPSRHQVDFCIFTENNVIFIEAKGRDLPMGKLKRKQVEEIYSIPSHVVKKPLEINEVVQTYG